MYFPGTANSGFDILNANLGGDFTICFWFKIDKLVADKA
jgi:hypothetical protein